MPTAFCQEVRKKILEMVPDGERVGTEHESNHLFKKEHDEQLLLWLNRLLKLLLDWFIGLFLL